jgi:hypothetical protein
MFTGPLTSTSWGSGCNVNTIKGQSSRGSFTLFVTRLDGPQVDDRPAWEIGYFYTKKSPEQKIIGIRTDFRRAGLGLLYKVFGLTQKFRIPCSHEYEYQRLTSTKPH